MDELFRGAVTGHSRPKPDLSFFGSMWFVVGNHVSRCAAACFRLGCLPPNRRRWMKAFSWKGKKTQERSSVKKAQPINELRSSRPSFPADPAPSKNRPRPFRQGIAVCKGVKKMAPPETRPPTGNHIEPSFCIWGICRMRVLRWPRPRLTFRPSPANRKMR